VLRQLRAFIAVSLERTAPKSAPLFFAKTWPPLVAYYDISSSRNTGIPEILEIPAVTRNSGVLRSGCFREQQAPLLLFFHMAH